MEDESSAPITDSQGKRLKKIKKYLPRMIPATLLPSSKNKVWQWMRTLFSQVGNRLRVRKTRGEVYANECLKKIDLLNLGVERQIHFLKKIYSTTVNKDEAVKFYELADHLKQTHQKFMQDPKINQYIREIKSYNYSEVEVKQRYEVIIRALMNMLEENAFLIKGKGLR